MLNENVKNKVVELCEYLVARKSFETDWSLSQDYVDGLVDGYQAMLIALTDKEVEFKIKEGENSWETGSAELFIGGTLVLKYREINHPEWGSYSKVEWKEESGRECVSDTCPYWKKEYI